MHTDHVQSSDSLRIDSAVLSLENGQPITAVDLKLLVGKPTEASCPRQPSESAIRLVGRTAAPIVEGSVLSLGETSPQALPSHFGGKMLFVERVRRLENNPMQWHEFHAAGPVPEQNAAA